MPLTTPQVRDLERRIAEAIAEGRDIGALETLLDRIHVERDFEDPDGLGEGKEALDLFVGDRYEEAVARLERAPLIPGHQRTGGDLAADTQDASRPAVSMRADGQIVVAWVEWVPDRGEIIKAILAPPGGTLGAWLPSPESVVSGEPGDCVRPTCTFDADGSAWVFYGKSVNGHVGVWASRHLGSAGWGEPELVSGHDTPAFNQEVACLADGRLECCYQAPVSGVFAIMSRTRTAGTWSRPRIISQPPSAAWDPAITALPGGRVAYAWSEYRHDAYRLCIRFTDGNELGPAKAITSGTDYALHPSLAAASSDAVWCAYDLASIQGHGGSGPTQLRPAEELGKPFLQSGIRLGWSHFERPHATARLEVALVSQDRCVRPPGKLAPGLLIRPAGLPRLARTAGGGLVVAYRVLREVPLQDRYWEVAAQVLGPDGWSGPILFDDSRASAEEVGLVTGTGGAVVVWQNDRRHTARFAEHETDPWRRGYLEDGWSIEDHLGDLTPSTVGSGAIRLGRIADRGPASLSGEEVSLASSGRVEARRWPRGHAQREVAEVAGATYQLFWGDFHRHSLVSRCLSGEEPTAEDYDRYSRDVCEYDFWALTDHAEHTSPYQWWTTKKRADLLRQDGHFVPFYGFEWTSQFGHYNVIYEDSARDAPIFSAVDPQTMRPDQLWSGLRSSGYKAITIPHHPGSRRMAVDWTFSDPEFVRLVEIFQACRGNYEAKDAFRRWGDASAEGAFVIDALQRGLRFGVIASSDHGYGSSYVGAYATELSRPSIFDALRARRTIAATTRDIGLEMRADGAFLGEEVYRTGPIEVEAKASAYAEIARLDLIRNGRLLKSVSGTPPARAGELIVPIHLEWDEIDGSMDWSGTLSIADGTVVRTPFLSPAITVMSSDSVSWTADMVRSHRGGIDLTVVGSPTAHITVATGPAQLSVTLRELENDTWPNVRSSSGGRLSLAPGFGGLIGLGDRRAALGCVDNPADGAWYMARVTLVDGEMAWSSPIWIDREPPR